MSTDCTLSSERDRRASGSNCKERGDEANLLLNEHPWELNRGSAAEHFLLSMLLFHVFRWLHSVGCSVRTWSDLCWFTTCQYVSKHHVCSTEISDGFSFYKKKKKTIKFIVLACFIFNASYSVYLATVLLPCSSKQT